MTTTLPSSRVFIRVLESPEDSGYYVQLDLHGNDLDGPFETEDEALERAEEAEKNGETSGNF